jgi:hypothetical protein
MIELRDGEVAVWSRCCQRRHAVPSLALALASRHTCGTGGNPATSGGVRAAGPIQGKVGWSIAGRREDNDVRGRSDLALLVAVQPVG